MSVPKTDTIIRYCDNGLAIWILQERGIISPFEAKMFHKRDRIQRDAAYARIYGDSVEVGK